MRDVNEIQNAMITRFRSELWAKFVRAVKDYRLIDAGDHVAVAISGGKDSLILAKLVEELARHGERPFTVSYLAMDPGYLPEKRAELERNLDAMGIPATIVDSDIFAVTDRVGEKSPCYLCARMRRGFLYAKAKELGANKLALGHHFDDVIETILLNLLYAGSYKSMLPKLTAKNFPEMELIRPLYLIRERDIIRFRDYIGLSALDCACTVTARPEGSKRAEVRALIRTLEQENPLIPMSIFRSQENVNCDLVLGYSVDGIRYARKDQHA